MSKKPRRGRTPGPRPTVKVTWAEFARDVLIRSMDRGQGPFYVFTMILTVLILKMSPDKVGALVDELIVGLKELWLIGYIAAGLLLLAWAGWARRQRSITFREQDRMGKEKARLQKKLLGDKLKSSRD